MSTRLAKYIVQLEAQTARYTQQLDSANKRLEGFERRNKTSLRSIRTAFQTALGALAIRQVSRFIQSQAEMASAIGDAARVADIGTGALQEYRFALSQLADVTDGNVDEALRRFNRRMGEVTRSGGPAKKAVEDLNLAMRDSSGQLRDTESLLDDVIESLGRITSPAQRSAVAAQLFGDTVGPQMASAIGQGSDAIRELRQQLRDDGGVIADENIQKAQAFTNQMDRMRRTLSTQMANTVLQNADAFETLASAIATVAGKAITMTAALSNFMSFVGEEIASRLHGVSGDDIPRLTGQLVDLDTRIRRVRGALESVHPGSSLAEIHSARLAELEAEREAIQRQIDSARERERESGERTPSFTPFEPPETFEVGQDNITAIERQIEALERQAATLGMSAREATAYRLAQDDATESQISAAHAAFDTIEAFEAQAEKQRAALEAAADFERVREGLRTQEQAIQESFARRLQIIQANTEAGTEAQSALVARLIEQTQQQLDNLATDMNEFAVQAARNMQTAFADFLFDPFADGLSGMLENFVNIIRRMVAEAAAAEILGSIGESMSGAGGFWGSLGQSLAGRKNGGPTPAGQAFMVGEEGPEVFIPNSSGRIQPIGGGATVVNHYDFRGADPASEARLRQAAEMTRRQTIQDVRNMSRRGQI